MKYFYSFFLFFLITSLTIQSQDAKPNWRELHYLSAEEMNQPFDFKRDFFETDPPEGDIRNVAEFDEMQAVLVRYPFGIPMSLVKELADDIEVITLVANASQQQTVINQYTANDVNLDNCSFLLTPTDSYWVRDYGPWFVFDGNNQPGIVNFPYNRPRPNDNDVPIAVAGYLDIDLYGMNLIQTGGNYMTDGLGKSSSTDLVWEENPSLSEEEINSVVLDYLDIDNYYVRPDPLDEYIKHIDCWGKFLSPGKVLIGQVPESDYRYDDFEAAADFFASTTSSYGKPYEVFRVFTPGTPPNTPYTNSLIANNKVLVPLTGSQWDDEAIASYEEAMPGYEVVGITYGGWMNTDALHCRAKCVADLEMLYMKHMPLLGTVGYEESYDITAEIIACSGEGVYADSVFVYYSINGGDYLSSTMQFESGTTWTGSIDGIAAGDDVDYYIYAADESGRRVNHPYIGEPDPHEFHAFGVNTDDLQLTPDTLLFLTYEDCLDGKTLNIINISSDSVEILEITPESVDGGFYWMVLEMPDLPLKIGANDTLALIVIIAIPVSFTGELLQDTIFVTTTDDEFSSLIMVEEALVQSQNEIRDPFKTIIYPNPFRTNLNIEIDLRTGQDITIRLYDLSGKMVYESQEKYSLGSKQIISIDAVSLGLHSGTYIYQVSADGQTRSGKVVYKP